MVSIRRLYASREQEVGARAERAARRLDRSLPVSVKPTARWQVRYRDTDGREQAG